MVPVVPMLICGGVRVTEPARSLGLLTELVAVKAGRLSQGNGLCENGTGVDVGE